MCAHLSPLWESCDLEKPNNINTLARRCQAGVKNRFSADTTEIGAPQRGAGSGPGRRSGSSKPRFALTAVRATFCYII